MAPVNEGSLRLDEKTWTTLLSCGKSSSPLTWWIKSATTEYPRGRKTSRQVIPVPTRTFSSSRTSMYGTNEERESGVNICRVATSSSYQFSKIKDIGDSDHLSRRNIFWRTIFQQPDARFWKDVKVMFDLVIRRTPQYVG